MLELISVNISLLGRKIIDDLSFNAKDGDIIGLVGVNGAGKTTCIRTICGILEPQSGEIKIAGQNLKDNRTFAQKQIGLVLEGAPLWGDMNAKEYLEFLGNMHALFGNDLKKAIIKAVEITKIQNIFHQKIDTLSKGFKRRVAFAGAILHDPKILILDEPTDGLDPEQRAQALDILAKMGKDRIIIFSTHILGDIGDICNRIIVINNGKKIADETIDEFKKNTSGKLENAFFKLTGGGV